ncbi:cadmium-translocating P-type ATPase [Mycolicibacterium sp. CH28]|uniref:heavy metal translocating P-type ATPase n=1 Tax=Mycolicibacterium sp. CH28 TaxID=2512237 RepID=UPI001081136D|nr:heavy metal translocating P-type ATPase [Mycolicibacterium sp. CH28]TGD88926.1 cadmium-translocating P-type ATPase [Mycolicibacterium sp. CH28]
MITTDLQLTGMSCASCAATIERGLNDLAGVHATVNFAVERAHVEHGPQVSEHDLIHAVESTGYHAAVIDHSGGGHDHMNHDVPADQLRPRLIGSTVLAVPVVALSMVMAWQFPGWQWLVLALTTPIVFWGGYPFHKAAVNSARHGASTMDTLVSIGTLAAYGWSLYEVLTGAVAHGHGHVYFEVAAAVTVFLLAGRYAEAKAKRSAGAALRALLSLGAKDAVVLRDDAEIRIPAEQLRVGDVIVVRPGERVATDGVVEDGESALDTSAMTGESVPVDVRAGDEVLGGAVNTYGRILVRARKVGADTQLARMARMVTDAQSGKASIQRLADRVSAVFVPIVLGIAGVTLVGWLLTGGPVTAAFTAAVAVLIIACPCALGLATPTAILVGTGRGAQLGVLIKEPQVLETVTGIDTIVLDKTGTVTTGTMSVATIETEAGADADAVLTRAAAVESASEHPVAAAIVAAARDRGLAVPAVRDFTSDPGTGVSGVVEGVGVQVARFSDDDGRTSVAVTWDGARRGVIRLVDGIKPTSAAAITELKSMGITPMLLTGDNPAVAARVAAEVGIAPGDVVAGVLPSEKADMVKRLQAQGRKVAMVGDGVNDSVALATADVGMAMGTGTDAAIEAGDITLVRGDLRMVPTALRLSARTLRIIKQNLFWAFGYNVAAIPLAALGLLNPMIAGATMALSSVLVVSNSLRLKRFK